MSKEKRKHTGRKWFATLHSYVDVYWDLNPIQKESFIDYIFEVQMYGRSVDDYPTDDPLVRAICKGIRYNLRSSLLKYDNGLKSSKLSELEPEERDNAKATEWGKLVKGFDLAYLNDHTLLIDKLFKKLVDMGKDSKSIDNLEVYLKAFQGYVKHRRPTWQCSEKSINAIFERSVRLDELDIENMEGLV